MRRKIQHEHKETQRKHKKISVTSSLIKLANRRVADKYFIQYNYKQLASSLISLYTRPVYCRQMTESRM